MAKMEIRILNNAVESVSSREKKWIKGGEKSRRLGAVVEEDRNESGGCRREICEGTQAELRYNSRRKKRVCGPRQRSRCYSNQHPGSSS